VQPTLDARYPGTLSVSRADDGTLTLTVKLPFERYLQGIAEVPPSWPLAALEAQAIAARTYALAQTGWRGTSGERLRAPICATTSCQVYRGLPVNPEADIGRWYAAVNRTAGRVLLFGGRPADTLYFSTSNGRTYGNDQVFGTAPLPYLRPVSERDDRASPESHWRTAIPLPQLTRFLRAAGAWPAGAGVTDVARRGDAIEVSGHGVSRSLGVDAFRTDVNAWAPCLAPRRYPQPSRTGTPLPVTVPSGWFRLSQAGGAAVLNGRGWGHGVGMVQWGAYGKAERGLSADRILAAYYGGLRPQPFPEPGTIRVQVADGVRSVSIGSSGAGAVLDGRRIGPSTVTIRAAVGGGLTVSVRPAP
jgi:stage II sporulation protein D